MLFPYMRNENTDDQISIQLDMASTPMQAAQAIRMTGPQFRMPEINFAKIVQTLALVCVMAGLSAATYFVVSQNFVKSVEVIGVSMVPTLQEHNHYLLNLWAFHSNEPQRKEIVVIRDPGDHGLSVKRIIAVPGESVLFKDGRVYVNGRRLDEPYLLPNARTFTYSQAKEQFITCGKDQYFVLGDNRLRSIDSRSYGPVSRQDILGMIKLHWF